MNKLRNALLTVAAAGMAASGAIVAPLPANAAPLGTGSIYTGMYANRTANELYYYGDYNFNGTRAWCLDSGKDGPVNGGTYAAPTRLADIEKNRELAYLLATYGGDNRPAAQAALASAIYNIQWGKSDMFGVNRDLFDTSSRAYLRANQMTQYGLSSLNGRVQSTSGSGTYNVLTNARAMVTAARNNAVDYSLSLSATSAKAGAPVTLTARVSEPLNNKVSGVKVFFKNSAGTVIGSAVTNASGVATMTTTATTVGSNTVTASISEAALPTISQPQYSVAQRMLMAGGTQYVSASATYNVTQYTPKATTVTSDVLVRGTTTLTDRVTVSGGQPGAAFSGKSVLYGPLSRQPVLSATVPAGTPVVGTATYSGTYGANGTATVSTTSLTVTKPGYYVWVESLNGTTTSKPYTAPYGEDTETTLSTNPVIKSTISDQTAVPGEAIHDTLTVTGIPYLVGGKNVVSVITPVLSERTSTTSPWTVIQTFPKITVKGTATYTNTNVGGFTVPTTAAKGSMYSYSATMVSFLDANNNGVQDTGEDYLTTAHNTNNTVAVQATTVGQPSMQTQTSKVIAKPGDTIADTITVTGLNAADIQAADTIKADLIGVVAPVNGSCDAITDEQWDAAIKAGTAKTIASDTITGAELQTAAGTTTGKFAIKTSDVTIPANTPVGCITWVETATFSGTTYTTPPDAPNEQTLVVNPEVTTAINNQVSTPGQTITDTATVTGIPEGVDATIGGDLRVLVTDGTWTPVSGVTINKDVTIPAVADAPLYKTSFSGLGAYVIPKDTAVGTKYTYSETVTVNYDANGDGTITPNEQLTSAPHNAVTGTATPVVAQTTDVINPSIQTRTSAFIAKPGAEITDSLIVTGTGGKTGTVKATLLGYVNPVNGSCENIPATTWAKAKEIGSVDVTIDGGDKTYVTGGVTLPADSIGCVTWVENGTIGDVPVETTPGAPNESTLVVNPNVTTKVSSQSSTPGQVISDTAIVTGVPAGVPATIGGGLNSQVAGGEWAPVDGVTISKAVTGSGTFAALGAYTVPANAVDGTKFSYNEKVSVWYDQNKDGKVDEGETIESAPHNADNTVAAQTSTVVVPPQPTPPQPTPEQPFIPVTPEQPVTQVDAGGDQSQGSADSGGIDGGVIGDPTDVGGALAGGGLLAAGVALIAGLKRRRK